LLLPHMRPNNPDGLGALSGGAPVPGAPPGGGAPAPGAPAAGEGATGPDSRAFSAASSFPPLATSALCTWSLGKPISHSRIVYKRGYNKL
jgi:hypothetical protein